MGGINLKAKDGFALKIKGTDYEVPTVYIRTRFTRDICGKKLEVQANIYLDENKYREDINNVVLVEIINLQDNSRQHLQPIFNLGTIVVPENHDENDLRLSHETIIQFFRDFLEIPNNEVE